MTAGLLAVVLALSLGQSPPPADLEREARAIDATLVAPCCFRQEVSVHQSAAADEVRRDVRARLTAGQTREQIIDAYVSRYGKRILVEPPAVGFDLMLYIMPFVMLIASLAFVTMVLRRFTRISSPNTPASASDGPAACAEASVEDRIDDELRDLD
jgi:cytochrome c-type biogenesis protein CcmH